MIKFIKFLLICIVWIIGILGVWILFAQTIFSRAGKEKIRDFKNNIRHLIARIRN